MLLKDLPEKLQDFAIAMMVECDFDTDENPELREDIRLGEMFAFADTDEIYEWVSINYHNNLEPMYTKYPELR